MIPNPQVPGNNPGPKNDRTPSITVPSGPFSGIYSRVDADTIACADTGVTLTKVRSADSGRYKSKWFLRQVFPSGGHRFVSTLWGSEFEAGSLRYRISKAGNDQFLVTVIRKVRHRKPKDGAWGASA